MKHYLLSIVIATYNSEKHLPKVLASIKKQDFPQDKIEIIIVDGGSSDKTLLLAKKFNCKIISNSKIEPVNAKIIGYQNAKGDYIVYLDADEEIENPSSLVVKYSIFKKYKKVRAVIGSGYRNPVDTSFTTWYINEFGDPFSFFVYRLSKNTIYYYQSLKRLFPILIENRNYVLFDFSKNGKDLLLELGAADTMIDLKYLRKEFPQFNSEIFAHLFQYFLSKSIYVAMVKEDPVIHYSTDSLIHYMHKINWRIKNNIYHISEMGISGFQGREQYHSISIKLKKYLFLPYAFSLILPFYDALHLILTRRKITYFLHTPLTVTTACLIVYYYVLKILGIKLELKNYDETTRISSHTGRIIDKRSGVIKYR